MADVFKLSASLKGHEDDVSKWHAHDKASQALTVDCPCPGARRRLALGALHLLGLA